MKGGIRLALWPNSKTRARLGKMCFCESCMKASPARAEAKKRILADLQQSPFLRKDKR